ncbi:MAG: site-specific integrase [Methanomassiliicoccales archaeon]|nr:MAG: site-specific integrase [Methanomassiliicoccales archaeon]
MKTNGMSINVSRTDKYFNEADVRQLLSSIAILEDKALIAFGIDTGLRVSEVVGVITSNINFDENAVLAYDHKKDEWRNVIFTQPVGNLLQMYLNERSTKDQRLFPFSWKTAERKVKRWCKVAGIKISDGTRKVNGKVVPEGETYCTWHYCRGTFMRMSRRVGRDMKVVQQNTGDSVRTILEYYGDLSLEDRAQEMEEKPIIPLEVL